MKTYNTLTRAIETFQPLNSKQVTLYTCGPTVYDYTHIGHARKYINDDVIKKTLQYLGYKVYHVMNITDVGHLSSDSDAGEDKLEKGAKKYGKTVWEVAEFYTKYFFDSLEKIHVTLPDIVCKATGHISDMIELIKRLEQKGVTYDTKEAVYFDISKFPSYTSLSRQTIEEKVTGARDDVVVDPQKRSPADFALWFKRVGRFADHAMHWESPWGDGFPGWHIECSAMSMKYLGETIDIHTGGVDHIPVHHTNEIAQSEAATGKQFVRYWMHHEFLQVEGEKMSKSLENFFTVDDLIKKDIDPASLRLLFLQTHYRQPMNFTWEAAKASQEALRKLRDYVLILKEGTDRSILSEEKLEQLDAYRERFTAALANDFQLPQAVAVMWEMLKSNIPSLDKLDLLLEFDRVFSLGLADVQQEQVPETVREMAEKRLAARHNKDFSTSDSLREQIYQNGYTIEDTPQGYTLKKK